LGNSHINDEPITLPQHEKTNKWNTIRNAHQDLVTELDRESTPSEICDSLLACHSRNSSPQREKCCRYSKS
jgi:hypothetical protein